MPPGAAGRRTTKVREDYLAYLSAVRNLSPHTLESYGKDLEKYEPVPQHPRRGRRTGRASPRRAGS